jgi:hypothetical protein
MRRGAQTIYDQLLTKHNRNDQIRVDKFQESHVHKIKNRTPRITQDWVGEGGGHWGIGEGGVGWNIGRGMIIFRYSRPLLIANALTQAPYSRELLIDFTELF